MVTSTISTLSGARFGYVFITGQDRPQRPFTIYEDVTGRRVVIPAGEYAWTWGGFEGHTNLSAPIAASLVHKIGSCYGNDRRDTSPFTADALLGRSFIVRYTRLFDY